MCAGVCASDSERNEFEENIFKEQTALRGGWINTPLDAYRSLGVETSVGGGLGTSWQRWQRSEVQIGSYGM